MTAALAESASEIEKVLIGGDLAKLTPEQRITYYRTLCDSIGINPMTRPFNYLQLSGKLVLYANKDCTDQLRAKHNVSVYKMDNQEANGLYVSTAYVELPSGRKDCDVGAVNIENLKGDNRANAIMKATTKAKRRATLSICGLGILDEIELETVPGAYRVVVSETGEVLGQDGGSRDAQRAIVDEAQRKETPATVESIADRRAQQEAEAVAELDKHTVKHPPREKAKGSDPVLFKMLESFQAIKIELKKEAGDDTAYYGVLAQCNYKKSNEIPDIESGATVYKMLAAALKSLRWTAQQRAELKELSSRAAFISPEIEMRFNDALYEAGFKLMADVTPSALPDLLAKLREIVVEKKP